MSVTYVQPPPASLMIKPPSMNEIQNADAARNVARKLEVPKPQPAQIVFAAPPVINTSGQVTGRIINTTA